MIRPIRVIAGLLGIAMLALLVNVSYIQVVAAGDLREKTGNRRVIVSQYDKERGPILVGSQAIASSVDLGEDLRFQRVYEQGEMYAPVTGFMSMVYGSTGLERAENQVLSGSSPLLLGDRIEQLFAGKQSAGGAVTTTIDPRAQQAAYRALGSKVGSVVAIEPESGRILAMVQSPSFDPNVLASHQASTVLAYHDSLKADPDKPLLNRPIVSVNPPGSTFKLVTAAAALASGRYTPESILPGPRTYRLPGTSTDLRNWNDRACGSNDEVTLRRALEMSCNTAFAWLGVQLGAEALRAQAQAFGFDTGFEIPLRAATSRFPDDPDIPQTALAAIGQFDVRATALQMAMVAAGIANDGEVMMPTLVSEIRSPSLAILESPTPIRFATALSPENARLLTAMMQGVVEQGTGGNAAISGVGVAGKSGTAQTSPDRPSVAWFVAFAPADAPTIAVAVAVEDAATPEISGNGLAAPIARSVIDAVLP